MPQAGDMRPVIPCLAMVALCLAAGPARSEDVARTVVKYDFDIRDVYGNPMRSPEVDTIATPNGQRSTVRTGSVNGQKVKLESVSEKAHTVNDHTRIIERTIQRYDPNGNPVSVERQRITETQNPDGTVNAIRETYSSDVNGHMDLKEKSETTERKTGAATMESQTVVSRPSINGGFDVVERADEQKNASGPGKWSATRAVYRKGAEGFFEAVKTVTDHAEQGPRETENTAEYEVGSSGALELHSQTTKQTVKAPDGSSVTSIDYFNRHAPGYAITNDQQLALRVREVVEHRPEGKEGAVDTLTVQHPSITDPTRLDPPKVVSETVCTGNCK